MEDSLEVPRPRADSAAAQREARELRKEQRQAEDARRAVTNRFTRNQQKETKPKEALPEQQQEVEIDNQQDAEGDKPQVDESDDENQEEDPMNSALVVNPSRAQRRLRASNAVMEGHRHQRFTVRPEPLRINSSAGSKLVADFQLQKAAGVFVENASTTSNSLVRMEQRLLRESETSNQRREAEGQQVTTSSDADSEGRTARLLAMLSGGTEQDNGSDTEIECGQERQFASSTLKSKPPASSTAEPNFIKPQRTRLAWLQITVSRVELEDHALFSVSDRLSAHLRVLVSAYSLHQRQRRWELPLQRVKAFVAHAIDHRTAPTLQSSVSSLAASSWSREAQRDAECSLQSLQELQQLHSQILQKWDELQTLESNGFGRPEIQCETFISLFSLSVKKRAEHIALDSIQALIEILHVGEAISTSGAKQGKTNQDEDFAALTTKLRQVIAAGTNQSLDAVVEIKRRLETSPERRRVSHYSANAPQFYVLIYVNGRLACRTRSQCWGEANSNDDRVSAEVSAGVVVFNETFRLRLPHFPSSVSARVFELRGFASKVLPLGYSWSDEPLSARPVPVIVPGSEQQREAASYHSTQQRRNLAGIQCNSKASGTDIKYSIGLIPAASVGASHEWYQFCAAVDLPRSRWHRSILDAPSMAGCSRRVQGRIGISVTWTPSTAQENTEIPYLPPPLVSEIAIAASTQSKVQTTIFKSSLLNWPSPPLVGPSCTNRNEGGTYAGFAHSHQFQKHLAPEHFTIDSNDPANIRISKLQQSYITDQAISPLVGGVFRSFPDDPRQGEPVSLTKRNQLLRLRDRDRSSGSSTRSAYGSSYRQRLLHTSRAVLLEEPVPLLDSELLDNEVYLRLLRPELRAFDHELLRQRADTIDSDDPPSVQWTLLRRFEYQRVRMVEFLDREQDAQRRFVSESSLSDTSTTAANARLKPPLALSAIIQEQPLPLFPGSLELPALGDLFARRRRLRPRMQRAVTAATAASSAHWPTHCELYVQIQRATNVPLRIVPQVGNGDSSNLANILTPRRLRRQKEAARRLMKLGGGDDSDDGETNPPETPRDNDTHSRFSLESRLFVEVSFQGRARRTTCALISKMPVNTSTNASVEWMETLVLPFHSPGDDWSPSTLAEVDDNVNIRIYDRIVRADDSDQSTSIGSSPNKRLQRGDAKDREGITLPQQGKRSFHEEHCLLGDLIVPFAAIYKAHGIVDSLMRCQAPIEHLGYANINKHDQVGLGNFNSTLASSAESVGGDNRRQDLNNEVEEVSEVTSIDRIVKRSERDATHLHVMMTLNPLLPKSPVPTPPVSTGSQATSRSTIRIAPMILRDASQWASEAGLVTSVVIWLMGQGPVLLTQVLGPQKPPPGLTTAVEVAHFVRCLPLVDDWRAALNLVANSNIDEDQVSNNELDGIRMEDRSRKKSVWCTSQQCLDLCGGDPHEHAVLLCNYLLWLDQQEVDGKNEKRSITSVYLVFGRTITSRDETVFVLHQGASSHSKGGVLWDTSTGACYHLTSESCPLRQVLLVVSSENVFANVQGYHPCERRHQFNWDIEQNPKCWKPLVGIGIPGSDRSLLPCLQPEELVYTMTPSDYIDQVERELLETLKLSIRRWRSSHSTTVFNMNLSLKFRARLEQLESERALRLGTDDAETLKDTRRRLSIKKREETADGMRATGDFLSELQKSHDVIGVPIHMPFTDFDRIVRAVQDAVRTWLLLVFPFLTLALTATRIFTRQPDLTSSSFLAYLRMDFQMASCLSGFTWPRWLQGDNEVCRVYVDYGIYD